MKSAKTHKNVERFVTRAMVDASTIVDTDSEKSFWVVFATEAPVFRRGWDENFNEILLCNPENVRTTRLEAGAVPLLNNHDQSEGVEGQMGRIVEFSVEKGKCIAKVLFSTQERFAGIWQDIKGNVIRSISTGYNVYKYLREVTDETAVPDYKAVDWEPLEISLAPVPADFNSIIRNKQSEHEIQIENFQTNSNTMTDEQKAALIKAEKTRSAEIFKLVRAANFSDDYAQELVNGDMTIEQVRSAIEDKKAGNPILNEAEVTQKVLKAERERSAQIRAAVRAAGLEDEVAVALIDNGTSIFDARTEIINKLAEQNTPNQRTATVSNAVGADEVEKTRTAIIEAVMHRAEPGSVKTLDEKSKDYVHYSMPELARQCLDMKGERSGRFGPSEMITRALATTDFPLILGGVVSRFLRKFYETQNFDWKYLARQISAPDFRERTGIAASGKITFEEIAEGGQYKNAQLLTEESAKVKLKTFGRKITITRQAIINDDLGVFTYLPKMIAQGAANFQADKIWGLITSNAKTPDGKALFHADHANLAAGGDKAAPSSATLSKGRTAMWRQTTPAGEIMPVAPKYLVVPAELQTTAEQLMTSILANQTANVNIFASKYDIIVDPRLTDVNAWYLAADPSAIEGLVYAYLAGEEGLHVENKVDFDNDAVVTKARLDFDCNIWDYRGWYKNPGI